MRGTLPALMSLFVFMAVTEGDVFLCKKDLKTTTPAYDGEQNIFRSNNERNEELDQTDDDGAMNRMESLKSRILRARLMEDSEPGELELREEDSEPEESELREEDSEPEESELREEDSEPEESELREEDSEPEESELREEDSEAFEEQYGFD